MLLPLFRNRMTKIVRSDKRNLCGTEMLHKQNKMQKIIQLRERNFSGSYGEAELYEIPKYQVMFNSVTWEAIFYKKHNNSLLECTNIFLE